MNARLLIADEHDSVRDALKWVFAETGTGSIEEAATPEAVIQIVEEGKVDVVLLDIEMNNGLGAELLARINTIAPTLPVLVHSFCETCSALSRSFRGGAIGFIEKGGDTRELIRAIRLARDRQSVWKPEQLARIGRSQELVR